MTVFHPPSGCSASINRPCLARYVRGPETRPDALLGAGIPGWRDGSAYAVQHGRNATDPERRHGGRLRCPAGSVHRAYAELRRSRRLRHGVRPADIADFDSGPGRVDFARLRPRAGIARWNLRQTRTLPTDPRGLRPFSG